MQVQGSAFHKATAADNIQDQQQEVGRQYLAWGEGGDAKSYPGAPDRGGCRGGHRGSSQRFPAVGAAHCSARSLRSRGAAGSP